MTPVKVKICGVTRREDALAAARAGADAVGVNFWPGSKRYVTLAAAARILEGLSSRLSTVGVFVDAARSEIEEAIAALGLDAVQLHGGEAPEDCRGYRVKVIKALPAEEGEALAELAARYPADYVLLDTAAGGRFGGSGRTFSWDVAAGVAPGRLFLAGGLTPDNVAEAVRRVRPYAVDAASGVEVRPGIKDPGKLAEFVAHAKDA